MRRTNLRGRAVCGLSEAREIAVGRPPIGRLLDKPVELRLPHLQLFFVTAAEGKELEVVITAPPDSEGVLA